MPRCGPALVIVALLAFAAPSAAYTLRFEASSAERPFGARGCVPDKRRVPIPSAARHVHPGALSAYDGDSSVGTLLEGPLAFANQPSFTDEDVQDIVAAIRKVLVTNRDRAARRIDAGVR